MRNPTIERSQVDTAVVAAHEQVLEEWDDERIAELSEIVRSEAMYQPVDPTDTEAEFYAQREQVKDIDVEMKPVWEKLCKYAPPVIIGYEPVE